MKAQDAAALLSELADSLRTDPDQFYYSVNVNVTGLRVSASGAGSTGMSGVMGAGASGTGVHVQAGINQADIEFAQAAATQAHRAVLMEAADIIDAMADALADDGEPGQLKMRLQQLAGLAIPVSISAMVNALIRLVVGS